MSIKTSLENDLRESMRNKQEANKRVIRMVIAAIKNTEIERGQSIDDPSIIAILQKEIKIRQEEIEDGEKAGRSDIITASREEISILEAYLPIQLEEAELRSLIDSVIFEIGAKGPADMGRVMKISLARVQGRAPGHQVSRMVKELLQQIQ
jgi:uncharacterized protein YqeY